MSEERRLRHGFVVISGVHWFAIGLAAPVFVLLLQARGVSVEAVGALYVVHAVVIGLLELPTGGLADSWSRRGVLLLSLALTIPALVLLATSSALGVLAAGAVLLGSGRALQSGPLEAAYVDGVHAVDPAADLTPGLSAASRAQLVGLSVGTLLGGYVPRLVPLPAAGDAVLLSLSVPFLAAAAVLLVEVALVRSLLPGPDPGRPPRSARPMPRHRVGPIRTGLGLVRTSRTVRFVLLRFVLVGAAATAFEVLVPVRLTELTGTAERASSVYATITTVAFLLSAVTAGVAPQVRRWMRGPGRGAMTATIVAGAAGLVTGAPTTVVLALGYGATMVLTGPARPLLATILHAATRSHSRATMISLVSIASFAGSAVGGAALPALAAVTSTGTALVAAAGCLIVGGLLLVPVRER